jgi:hypothetical protein
MAVLTRPTGDHIMVAIRQRCVRITGNTVIRLTSTMLEILWAMRDRQWQRAKNIRPAAVPHSSVSTLLSKLKKAGCVEWDAETGWRITLQGELELLAARG